MVKSVGGAGASVRAMLTAGLLLLLASLTAAGVPAGDAVAAGRAEGDGGRSGGGGGQAAYLAEQLRAEPVYVTDQAPREIPRSAAGEFAKAAKRTGVPTYVVLLPERNPFDERLLGAVHDRLRRDGLYVLLDSSGIGITAVPFGVDVPAESAATVALYELPYDAGPLLTFQRFVEALTDDDPAGRAEAAREKYGSDAGRAPEEEPERLHITRTDRANQSFLTGILLAGVPLLALLLVPYVLRRRAARAGAKTTGRGFADVGGRGLPAAVATAAVLAGSIALGAAVLYDEETTDPGPPPTRADMDARLDRVSAGLAQDPVYVDPESPAQIDSAELAGLRRKIGGLDVPVYVASVPMAPEDESGGQADTFLKALGRTAGGDGVYVLADPRSGYVSAVDHGIGLDVDLYLLPEAIGYPPRDVDDDDLRLGERVAMLVEELDGARPGGAPGRAPSPMDPPDPVAEDALPSVFAADFAPGLFVGTLAAGLVFGLVAGTVRIFRRVRPARTAAVAAAGERSYEAPPDPSEAYLRRTAHAELEALAREFETADPAGALRVRVWDCLDAAQLLVDVEEDGRIDTDATAESLATAITLIRAARATLAAPGTPARLCTLNPMHGPAHGRQRIRPAPGAPARTVPLCAGCRRAARSDPGTAHRRRLTLPSPRGEARIPYDTAPGPLRTAGEGVPRLIREVQEAAGVHG
ncbi:hypothetical protein AA958_13050 [Streptomyces sp. CNQ-509]|uniref:hypothetical protein n=1 Tax=Streptomyces sp. CNQ-509 TaxID=444103 RepID=UPI00062DF07A|nr:hypothetical protein [Streptomyces sp. CNQ-509]AKH83001.1 hypothetical protein AA958_13050 [Streptomyces sp. CNQ-509]